MHITYRATGSPRRRGVTSTVPGAGPGSPRVDGRSGGDQAPPTEGRSGEMADKFISGGPSASTAKVGLGGHEGGEISEWVGPPSPHASIRRGAYASSMGTMTSAVACCHACAAAVCSACFHSSSARTRASRSVGDSDDARTCPGSAGPKGSAARRMGGNRASCPAALGVAAADDALRASLWVIGRNVGALRLIALRLMRGRAFAPRGTGAAPVHIVGRGIMPAVLPTRMVLLGRLDASSPSPSAFVCVFAASVRPRGESSDASGWDRARRTAVLFHVCRRR
jgi:hypothetical protein